MTSSTINPSPNHFRFLDRDWTIDGDGWQWRATCNHCDQSAKADCFNALDWWMLTHTCGV